MTELDTCYFTWYHILKIDSFVLQFASLYFLDHLNINVRLNKHRETVRLLILNDMHRRFRYLKKVRNMQFQILATFFLFLKVTTEESISKIVFFQYEISINFGSWRLVTWRIGAKSCSFSLLKEIRLIRPFISPKSNDLSAAAANWH